MCITTLGVVAALAGPWAERSGPRKVAAAAGLCWSTGLLLSSAAVATHSLPLLYLGYGLFGGAGCGLGYISNVSNLIKFFPDRRGLATGLALMAFGGGAMVAAPLNEYLFSRFKRLPEYLGPESAVKTVVEHGRRFADVGGTMREVLVASASDVATLPGVAEGVYVLGTGSSGVGTAFLALATGYGVAMFSGAAGSRVPAPGWLPDGYTPPKEDTAMVTSANVHHNTALRTPQFYLLWTAVAGNAVAGLTVLSCAKTMMGDIFSSALPAIVTGGFAASYVAALSCGNSECPGGGWSVCRQICARRLCCAPKERSVARSLRVPRGGSARTHWMERRIRQTRPAEHLRVVRCAHTFGQCSPLPAFNPPRVRFPPPQASAFLYVYPSRTSHRWWQRRPQHCRFTCFAAAPSSSSPRTAACSVSFRRTSRMCLA